MLRISLNKHDATPTYRLLAEGINTGVSLTISDGILTIYGVNTAGIGIGDKIRFVRYKCDGTQLFSDFTRVTEVSEDTVKVTAFPDVQLLGKPKKAFIKEWRNRAGSWSLLLESSNSHCFVENGYDNCEPDDKNSCGYGRKKITEYVYGDYTDYDKNKKRCGGDYVLYGEGFLFKTDGLDSKNRYVVTGNSFNYKNVNLKFKNPDALKVLGYGGQSYGWQRPAGDGNSDFVYLLDCVVPIDMDGHNVMNKVIWKKWAALSEWLPNDEDWLSVSDFSYEDERFYRRNDINSDDNRFSLKDMVSVFHEQTDIKINNVFAQDFETNLNQREELERKFFYEKNPIIDYEKQIFYPVYEDGGSLKDMQSIKYNVYLRKRDEDWKIVDGGDDYISNWNYDFSNNYNKNGDLVGYAGFDDDDVYYQKKKVGMSFLRLSLYDKKDRLTQSLLGYATMFLDTAELYKKYVVYKNKFEDAENVVKTEAADIRLNFKCMNKYNSSSSSEGFYFYLFPSLLNSDAETEKELYMKIEFNNAKYGSKVPLVLPIANGAISDRPYKDYMSAQKDYVNMEKLFDDMYIRVGVRFDAASNRYVWRFLDGNNEPEISICLFEPRVNG